MRYLTLGAAVWLAARAAGVRGLSADLDADSRERGITDPSVTISASRPPSHS